MYMIIDIFVSKGLLTFVSCHCFQFHKTGTGGKAPLP